MPDSTRPPLTAMLARQERTRLIRFAIVGVCNTLVTLLSYAVLLELGVPYPASAAVGYAAGILNGYTWNRLWTFEAGAFHLQEFSRYVLVQGGGLSANLLGLVLLVEALDLDRLIAEAISVVPIVLVTYLINRWWTFRPRPHSGSS